jgi:hypothetical protein
MFTVWAIALSASVAIPVLLTHATIDTAGGIAILAVWIGFLAAIWFWLKDEKEAADARTMFVRLVLGVSAGVAWSLLFGFPSILTILGGTWVFMIANMLFIGSIGYDRFLLEQRIREVGGRLLESEAEHRLRKLSDRSQ